LRYFKKKIKIDSLPEAKSSAFDFGKKKTFFFQLGLIMVLSFFYIALEWTQTSDDNFYEDFSTDLKIEEDLDFTQFLPPKTPVPSVPLSFTPPAPEIKTGQVLNVVENSVETKTIDIEAEDSKDKTVEIISEAATGASAAEESKNEHFLVVDVMPQFPGGEAALYRFLQGSIKYPAVAEAGKIQGRVVCQFDVNTDGTISNIQIVQGVHPSLDSEAIRVIQSMPRWVPGKRKEKPVKVRFTLPINFALQ